MQFQLSVFHLGGYISYSILSQEADRFEFQLLSAPPEQTAPQTFIATRQAPDQWVFEPALDKTLEEDVIQVLKRARV